MTRKLSITLTIEAESMSDNALSPDVARALELLASDIAFRNGTYASGSLFAVYPHNELPIAPVLIRSSFKNDYEIRDEETGMEAVTKIGLPATDVDGFVESEDVRGSVELP